MNPRPSSQPPEGDSRRFTPAALTPMGWNHARVVYVPVEATAS
jgi:hypothetical protein